MGNQDYDVLVLGGGHAGAEAAWAAARLGARTALVTFNREAIGRLSCNPAVGGIGKGQIVREIDALGGLMGRVTDEAGIQFRMLNRSKGPAVWAPRAQVDGLLYPATLRRYLETCPNPDIVEGAAEAIDAAPANSPGFEKRVTGVRLSDGRRLAARAVVVTTGTFLRGLMHTGEAQTQGGRVGEAAAVGLSTSLADLGLTLGRMKTGTPPRLARDTVDFSNLAQQPGDEPPAPFSFLTERIDQPQVCCWITHTNAAIHELIQANLHRAPMYSGQIQSRGPRYCPSIEDKVVRFADRAQHQNLPRTRNACRRADLRERDQYVAARGCAGAHHRPDPGPGAARVLQWGYAVEYDFVPPEQIDATLMTKRACGLFLAGQINGTSGYEEAAGQGLLAGINAARFVAGAAPVILGRDQAYIGVMIDDLVTRGVTEPYRMFTSRAEYRMQLRYDNADARLTPLGREIGMVEDVRWERFQRKRERSAELLTLLGELRHEGLALRDWLKRPDEDGRRFEELYSDLKAGHWAEDVWAGALVEIKYAGYVERQNRMVQQFRAMEERYIPRDLDYEDVPHLRREAVERWSAVRPHSIGQAARASGIHPTDVSALLVYLAARQSGNIGLK